MNMPSLLIPSFSTVACPDWTADRVFEEGATAGYQGVELRTFGAGSRGFASDPALCAPEKTRALEERTGVRVVSLGTGCRFDAPVWPPVMGHAFADTERSIREAKWHIDLAITLGCPLVRVFAFEPPPREALHSATQRIAQRLDLVVQHAHRTGVRLALENGGRYATASRLMAIIDEVDSPLLGVSYNVAVAHGAGEDPVNGLNVLGEKLFSLRIKDLCGGQPCPLGEGEVPIAASIRTLIRGGIEAPVIFEWDRAWFPQIAPPEQALGPGAARMFEWMQAAGGNAPAPAVAHR
jgi:sugar phosphate isomerase/epimerase